ncbi:MAG: GNAT family N-acetyltransferase [Micropruina sp.]|nr:MAG: GNAT family N-acetyltransferase [Micropruina sp.]
MTLSHGEVSLRPLRLRDERAWDEVRSRNRDWTGPWDSTVPPGSSEEAPSFRTFVRAYRGDAKRGRMLPWAVWCGTGPAARLAGQLTISGITRGAAQWAQAGYWVDRAWAGRGVIPTALALAADHLFGTLGLHRLEVAIRPENTKSVRVVEKLGFRLEGRRERYLHVAGDWRDHDVYVLTAEEVPDGVLARLTRS